MSFYVCRVNNLIIFVCVGFFGDFLLGFFLVLFRLLGFFVVVAVVAVVVFCVFSFFPSQNLQFMLNQTLSISSVMDLGSCSKDGE